MPMPTPSRPKFAARLVSTALVATVVVGALYFVAGAASVGICALGAALAICFTWTARNVETIADHIAASTRRAALVPARAAAPSRRKGV